MCIKGGQVLTINNFWIFLYSAINLYGQFGYLFDFILKAFFQVFITPDQLIKDLQNKTIEASKIKVSRQQFFIKSNIMNVLPFEVIILESNKIKINSLTNTNLSKCLHCF